MTVPELDAQIQATDNEHFLISGALTFATVPALWQHSATLFQHAATLHLDLSAVSHTDSAGLALLIEWLRAARGRDQAITFRNIPPQLLSMARISGVDKILPFEAVAQPATV